MATHTAAGPQRPDPGPASVPLSATRRGDPDPPAPPPRPGLRTDIQGLRALAVGLVVTYHLWPTALPGGFVGVDVFFVISGFLITGHLLNRPPRHWRDLAAFWSRRIRRLLPASLTVLVVSLLASQLLAPETQWANTARQVRAAALFVVNWRLAGDAVDYSAADAAASPVQHFWSLSVEEQFYLGWPLLIGVAVLLAARTGGRELRAVRVVLVGLVVGSLAYSIHLTAHDPARAYFVTPTRIWELGIGALLAAALLHVRWRFLARGSAPRRLRLALTWAGLLAVAVAAVGYRSATPFPGWQALLPVLGVAAVIATGDPRGPGAPGGVLALRPVQWLGGVSYAVYLWHWPLIVLLPNFSGGRLGWLDKTMIIAATLLLAAATKRFVEDPYRTRPVRRWWRPFVAAGLAIALLVGLSSVQLVEVTLRQRSADAQTAAALQNRGPCFGAAALDDPDRCSGAVTEPAVPAPAQASGDQYDIAGRLLADDACWASEPDFAVRTCTFGDPTGTVEVAVVGNSHAAQWLAPLEDIAERRGWKITTMLAHNCAAAATVQDFDTAEQTQGCQDWVTQTGERVSAGSYDLVITSNRISVLPDGESYGSSRPAFTAGYADVLRRWRAPKRAVVGIVDTPWPAATVGDVPDCLAGTDDADTCAGTRSAWVPADPLPDAVRTVDDANVQAVDLTDHLCEQQRCPAVVGGVVVYSDGSHLTTTYARTLAPYLDTRLTAALRTASG